MRVVAASALVWLIASGARADLDALPCSPSDVLSEAAALLMLTGEAPTARSLAQAANEAGFGGSALHASSADDDASLTTWLKEMQAREHAELLCGEAVTADRRLVVAAAFGGELELVRGKLVGTLAPGFGSPELVIQGADGKPKRMHVKAKELKDGVALPGGLKFPAQVQLVAEGPGGPRPVSKLKIDHPQQARGFTTAPPPAKPAPTPAPDTEGETEGLPGPALRSRLAAFRRTHGVPPLRENALLERSAQKHAHAVCQSGRVAHRLDGEDPVSRLRRERIEARAVGEAIGRSQKPLDAMQAIFDSPSHRYAVIERSFTDVGIGYARDDRGRSCVVVLLASWPRRIP